MKIFVAGHKGLVGSAIVRNIEFNKIHTWVGCSRQELDLMDSKKVSEFIAGGNFDAIILAAAKVGGIKANMDHPVEFLAENLQIQLNVIGAAHAANVEKFLFLGSSCIYPKFAAQPIREDSLLTGVLEATNEPYALAKIAGIKLIQAYRKEYGHNWISAMPTNLYGPNDNFNLETGHVLPALIAKFHSAKVENKEFVTLWGSGTPKREFLHVDDLASASMFLLENYDSDIAINVGTGDDVEIKELANLVSEIIGYQGQINWNLDMPDGTPRKLLDVSLINSLGWKAEINLHKGIEETYSWFIQNYKNN